MEEAEDNQTETGKHFLSRIHSIYLPISVSGSRSRSWILFPPKIRILRDMEVITRPLETIHG
jgi:hypothetical protein